MQPSMGYFLIFGGYFASFALYSTHFQTQRPDHLIAGKRLLLMSLGLHLVLIALSIYAHGALAITNLPEYVFAVSFMILLGSLIVERFFKAHFLMLFSLPVVLLFSLLTNLLAQPDRTFVGTNLSLWPKIHLGFILLGCAGLFLAVSSALMYLLQSWQLKKKQMGPIVMELPSLATVDRFHFIALSWGVFIYSLGILSGFLGLHQDGQAIQILKDPMVLMSFFTCAVYWLVVGIRFTALRQGQKVAIGTLLAFGLLLITLLSSQYLPSQLHKGF